jgi:NitT/TauT family transport system ATP-binding protein
MLKLVDIRHDYGQGPVLDGVSLELLPGRVTAIAGPSGCGKSTLLAIAAGLLAPQSGQVVNRFDRTAFVFQEPRLLPWRRTIANIAFGLKALGSDFPERTQKAEALANRLGLAGALDKYPHQLSGGMRQRVALGRALAVEPDLLLLDEPLGAQDPERRAELQDLLRSLIAERGTAALLVTHDAAEAERMADQVIFLSAAPGRVLQIKETSHA